MNAAQHRVAAELPPLFSYLLSEGGGQLNPFVGPHVLGCAEYGHRPINFTESSPVRFESRGSHEQKEISNGES